MVRRIWPGVKTDEMTHVSARIPLSVRDHIGMGKTGEYIQKLYYLEKYFDLDDMIATIDLLEDFATVQNVIQKEIAQGNDIDAEIIKVFNKLFAELKPHKDALKFLQGRFREELDAEKMARFQEVVQ